MDAPADLRSHPWFFCGIGGSGMLPLAQILNGRGARVAGSDRSFDQGRTPEKLAWLRENGIDVYPQDGSGVTSADQVLIASAAIEDSIPEIARARELGCRRMSRAELNASLFNRAEARVAIAGTSGKSTVTAMIGWILQVAGRAPTIMNGAVMKNFVEERNPFASAQVGDSGLYVSEVDESDGSIALYRPTIGVLLNVSLDHKSLEELRVLFGDFLRSSQSRVVNVDNLEARALASSLNNTTTISLISQDADLTIEPASVIDEAAATAAVIVDRRNRTAHPLRMALPGRHNLSNALAAIAGSNAAGVPVHSAVQALKSFAGIGRRFDVIGTTHALITVIDDFGHNPEKCAATLRTLRQTPGRVLAFFQPHGYGPLRQMGRELAETFARELADGDQVFLCDPVYFGGTADRSEGSERVVRMIEDAGGEAEYIPTRKDVADRLVNLAKPGDRIVIMGARDDTLTQFAREIFVRLS